MDLLKYLQRKKRRMKEALPDRLNKERGNKYTKIESSFRSTDAFLIFALKGVVKKNEGKKSH